MKKILLFLLIFLSFLVISCGPNSTINVPENIMVDKNGVVHWGNVDNAKEYVINLNGEEYRTNTNSFQLKDVYNDYTIKIISINGKKTSEPGVYNYYCFDLNLRNSLFEKVCEFMGISSDFSSEKAKNAYFDLKLFTNYAFDAGLRVEDLEDLETSIDEIEDFSSLGFILLSSFDERTISRIFPLLEGIIVYSFESADVEEMSEILNKCGTDLKTFFIENNLENTNLFTNMIGSFICFVQDFVEDGLSPLMNIINGSLKTSDLDECLEALVSAYNGNVPSKEEFDLFCQKINELGKIFIPLLKEVLTDTEFESISQLLNNIESDLDYSSEIYDFAEKTFGILDDLKEEDFKFILSYPKPVGTIFALLTYVIDLPEISKPEYIDFLSSCGAVLELFNSIIGITNIDVMAILDLEEEDFAVVVENIYNILCSVIDIYNDLVKGVNIGEDKELNLLDILLNLTLLHFSSNEYIYTYDQISVLYDWINGYFGVEDFSIEKFDDFIGLTYSRYSCRHMYNDFFDKNEFSCCYEEIEFTDENGYNQLIYRTRGFFIGDHIDDFDDSIRTIEKVLGDHLGDILVSVANILFKLSGKTLTDFNITIPEIKEFDVSNLKEDVENLFMLITNVGNNAGLTPHEILALIYCEGYDELLGKLVSPLQEDIKLVEKITKDLGPIIVSFTDQLEENPEEVGE